MSRFQRMFFVLFHSKGKPVSFETPDRSGPRNCGQSLAAAARGSGALCPEHAPRSGSAAATPPRNIARRLIDNEFDIGAPRVGCSKAGGCDREDLHFFPMQ